MLFYQTSSAIVTLFALMIVVSEGHIRDVLKDYDTLQKSDIIHRVKKRDTSGNEYKVVSFNTLGRHFTLHIVPNVELFSENFHAFSVGSQGKKEVLVDKDSFYRGVIEGEKESHVSVHLDGSLMTALISTKNETYVIEPSWRHIESDKFEMISYRHSDVMFNFTTAKASPSGGKLPYSFCGHDSHNSKTRYSTENIPDFTSHRDRRAVMQTRVRCPLNLVADYRFYRAMGQSDEKNTINYMIGIIDRVDQIFKNTVWSENYGGFGFEIGQVIVHKTATVDKSRLHYNEKRANWNIKQLLEVFSYEKDWKNYCLAHLFTYQDFADGVIGLAYVGNRKRNAVGGICTEDYRTRSRTLYLNTGLSSSINWGRRVLTEEADIVTAHEFGHNFGSEHDPDTLDCAPSERSGGKYIMYPASVSGQRPNNKKFSPCSRRQVNYVLKAKSQQCFTEPRDKICGNYKKEAGEECDPGNLGTSDSECCTKDCKLKPGSVCSDGYDSPCCDKCTYAPGKVCRQADASHCQGTTTCLSMNASCPESPSLPDNTTCIERGKCRDGKCVEFCIAEDKEPCLCDAGPDACKVCCQGRQEGAKCTAWLNQTSKAYLTIKDGRLCKTGSCRKGKCEKTTQDAIERFWNLITNLDVNTFVEFMRANIVGTILFFSLCIWIPVGCIVHRTDIRRDKQEAEEEEWRDRKNTQLLRAIAPTSKGEYIYRQDSFARPKNPQKPLKLKYNYIKTRQRPNVEVSLAKESNI